MRGLTIASSSSRPSSATMRTCRRCKQLFNPTENHSGACRFHPLNYSGGEVAKAIGFVRASSAPEDQLKAVIGKQGLMQFWDCCGDENSEAPGCSTGRHSTYDEEEEEGSVYTAVS